MVGTVRELVRQALRVVEVLAPSSEERGFQQGLPTPAVVRRRRNDVAAHLRTEFIGLWERAASAVSHAGLSALMDDDEGSVVRDLPPKYTSAWPGTMPCCSSGSRTRSRVISGSWTGSARRRMSGVLTSRGRLRASEGIGCSRQARFQR